MRALKFMLLFSIVSVAGFHTFVQAQVEGDKVSGVGSQDSEGVIHMHRRGRDGALGQDVEIELRAPSKSKVQLLKLVNMVGERRLKVAAGWYHLTCRSLIGGGVHASSLQVKADSEVSFRCFFPTKKQKRPTQLVKPETKTPLMDLVEVEPTGLSHGAPLKKALRNVAPKAAVAYSRPQRRSRIAPQSQLMIGGANFEAHGQEEYAHVEGSEYRDVRTSPRSTFSVDVDGASYTNVRRMIGSEYRLPPAGAVRIEEFMNYFTYDYQEPNDNEPFGIHSEVSTCPWNPKARLVHIGLQTKAIEVDQIPASNLVFLIDVSGSMGSANKLPLLKKAFSLLVKQLRPQDRVSIVTYAGREALVLPSTSGLEKTKILSALNALHSQGSTAGAAGIRMAYQQAQEHLILGGNNRVILATDGDFNVGLSSESELVQMIKTKRAQGISLSVLGFGRGNYHDSTMEALSNHGDGVAHYIDSESEAKRVLVENFGANLFTVARDVKIQVEFNPAHVKSYRLIGYENRALADADFNNDKKDAGDVGAGHAVTALYELIPNESSQPISVDPLKYQAPMDKTELLHELLTLKIRYKKPGTKKSEMIESVLIDHQSPIGSTSSQYRFVAAVAQFAMLLRDSKHKGSANYASVLSLASGAKEGRRLAEREGFLKLVRRAQSLSMQASRRE